MSSPTGNNAGESGALPRSPRSPRSPAAQSSPAVGSKTSNHQSRKRISMGESQFDGLESHFGRHLSIDEPQLEFDEDSFTTRLAEGGDMEDDLDLEDSDLDFSGGGVGGVGLLDRDQVVADLDEDDFEAQLGSAAEVHDEDMTESEYHSISKHRIIELAGDDSCGRKVVVFSACRLPKLGEIDHNKLLQYLLHTLDRIVENDYSLVYFHYGLHKSNKPNYRWLLNAYQAFDRKYKKNMKALYVVHPTKFVKFVWRLFTPILSVKFGKKVTVLNYLHQLDSLINLNQLNIPEEVKDHDIALLARDQPAIHPTSIVTAPLDTQQFGVTLEFMQQRNDGDAIPRVLRTTAAYLSRKDNLKVEGLFRRSGTVSTIKDIQTRMNRGEDVFFDHFGGAIYAAVIFKTFLRELPEPLITYELFGYITRLYSLGGTEQMEEARCLLLEELPLINYEVLKFVIGFLRKVESRKQDNLMDFQNLSIVMGPNLAWSREQSMLGSIAQVNSFTHLLLTRYELLFTK